MCELTRNLRSTLLAAAIVLAPAAASAATIAFGVSGTAANASLSDLGSCGSHLICAFSGTLTIDITTGTVNAVDVTFPGLLDFNTLVTSMPTGGGGGWSILAGNSIFDSLQLVFATNPNPGSLVGFEGGGISFLSVVLRLSGPSVLYDHFSGSIFTPAAAVPEPSTWAMMLLGFACLGFAFRKSRRKILLIGLHRSSLNRLAPASLVAALLLSVPAPSSANTITTFDVSGTATNESMSALGSCGAGSTCAFSGTLTVDATAGALTALNLPFPGVLAFDLASIFTSASSVGFGWAIQANNGTDGMQLVFRTTPTPGSLVGFQGGSIDTAISFVFANGSNTILYDFPSGTGGTITAPVTVVPEPSTWAMMLLGFAGLGFAFRHSRRKMSFV